MVPDAAVKHYEAMQRFQALVVLAGARLWSEVSLTDLSGSWAAQVPLLVPVLTGVQVKAASAGASYGAATLAEQGLYEAPRHFVNPSAFGGIASDGRSLEGALYSAVPYVKNLIGGGMAPAQALRSGGKFLTTITRTQVADAGRGAAGVDTATRKNVGYVRMLNPPSCSRCSILAGRFYRWNNGFNRHPKCFPEGTVISGPASEAATRRWYEGEMVTLSTASGEKLSLTGNHPVLTSRGWVPANLVREGDEVFRSTRTKGAAALVVPDHDQVPALIEDVWRALSVGGLDTMPTTAEDFHGDGQEGEVDVVYADSALGNGDGSPINEHLQEQGFSTGGNLGIGFHVEGPSILINGRYAAHSRGAVGGNNLLLPVSGAHLGVSYGSGFAHGAAFNSGGIEPVGYDASGYSILLGEGVFAGPGEVGGDDVLIGDGSLPTRWDAPGLAFDMETADGYASVGRDLVERMSGQVEADRVVKAVSAEFRGHVYSVTSSEGWHSANSLIVSNCDCVHVQTTARHAAETEGLIHDPYEYFKSLSPEDQDKAYTKAGAQAIRDGSDIFQVVNSRRGMKPGGLMTTEGTSKRGNFRVTAGDSTRGRRLTPEAIYKLNGDNRAAALKDLEKYGYILPGGQNPLGSITGQREGFGALGHGGAYPAARKRVEDAITNGRDPSVRATMTASERRLFDAKARWELVQQGVNPYGAPSMTPRARINTSPLTPQISAQVEKDYRRWVASGGQVFK